MSSDSTFCPITGHLFSLNSIALYLSYYKTERMVNMPRIIESSQKNIIGKKVRELRLEKHLTQQELSARLETMAIYICRGSVSRIEDQSRTVTDIELYGLSQVLATPVEEFFRQP